MRVLLLLLFLAVRVDSVLLLGKVGPNVRSKFKLFSKFTFAPSEPNHEITGTSLRKPSDSRLSSSLDAEKKNIRNNLRRREERQLVRRVRVYVIYLVRL